MVSHFLFSTIIFIITDIVSFRLVKKSLFNLFYLYLTILIASFYYLDFNFNNFFFLYTLYLTLFFIFYKIVFTGIKNTSPSLYIIHLILNNKKFLKKSFLQKEFTKKRIKENLEQNLLKSKNNRLQVTQKGYFILFLFNIIQKYFLIK